MSRPPAGERAAMRRRVPHAQLALALLGAGLLAVELPGLEAAMAIENRNQIVCSRTEDAREGMRAFLEKRPARFTGA